MSARTVVKRILVILKIRPLNQYDTGLSPRRCHCARPRRRGELLQSVALGSIKQAPVQLIALVGARLGAVREEIDAMEGLWRRNS